MTRFQTGLLVGAILMSLAIACGKSEVPQTTAASTLPEITYYNLSAG